MTASPQKLTTREVNAFLVQMREQLSGGNAQIDLSGYEPVDSAAVAALLALKRDVGAATPRFLNPSQNLRKLAVLYGVESILFPT